MGQALVSLRQRQPRQRQIRLVSEEHHQNKVRRRDRGALSERHVVEVLVVLAHDLNMQVVVEGVETVQQLEAIKAIGGNEVQGYLLGRPTAEPQDLLRTHLADLSPATADIGDSFTTKKSGDSDQAERRAQKAGV